ncbi:helix-turn-helix domain-containing protein [Mitsuokella sp. WILCCON 0060]|uniref:helix-turn-helix domain-containing protein n=1 Tax=Mitsuokella sp. WILCCON 0060 TaxID=3345341 RepID=UPI003F192DDB
MKAARKLHIWSTRLKDLRIQNNLSQSDVAKVIHCSQVSYGMYELGKRKIPVDKMVELAKYYHVSLDYLTGLSETF